MLEKDKDGFTVAMHAAWAGHVVVLTTVLQEIAHSNVSYILLHSGANARGWGRGGMRFALWLALSFASIVFWWCYEWRMLVLASVGVGVYFSIC